MTAEPLINKDIRNRNKMRGTLYVKSAKNHELGYSIIIKNSVVSCLKLFIYGSGVEV